MRFWWFSTSLRGQLQWGTGSETARARIATLTRQELRSAGVTREIADEWRNFYRFVAKRTPDNPNEKRCQREKVNEKRCQVPFL